MSTGEAELLPARSRSLRYDSRVSAVGLRGGEAGWHRLCLRRDDPRLRSELLRVG